MDIQENGAHQTQELVAQKVKKKLVDTSVWLELFSDGCDDVKSGDPNKGEKEEEENESINDELDQLVSEDLDADGGVGISDQNKDGKDGNEDDTGEGEDNLSGSRTQTCPYPSIPNGHSTINSIGE